MSLARALSSRRASGRAAFVPFLVAGDPTPEASLRLAAALAAAGADILEVGVPFSDPVADGPVIQAAGQRALKKGMSLAKSAALVGRLRRGSNVPVILFTYLNPILRMGWKTFSGLCAKNGVNGVLVVDLPAEESAEARAALAKNGVELVLLASPTTTDERLAMIGKATGSTLYYVSRQGVTGVRKGLEADLANRIRHVGHITKKPLLVGFGVAEPAQAKNLSRHADAVVVGSALVKANHEGGVKAAERLAKRLVAALEI